MFLNQLYAQQAPDMKSTLSPAIFIMATLLATFCLGSRTDAGVLTWSDAAFVDAAQINNRGDLVYALNFGSPVDVSVNDVLFESSRAGDLTDSSPQASPLAPLIQFGSNDNQNEYIGAAYGGLGVAGMTIAEEVDLLNSFVYDSSFQGIGFQLRGLTVGQTYQFQALVVDNRGDTSIQSRSLHFGSNSPNTPSPWYGLLVDYTSNVSSGQPYARLVQTTFVADSTTQPFATGIQNRGEIHFNAIQLRDVSNVPEPSSLALFAIGVSGSMFIRRRRR